MEDLFAQFFGGGGGAVLGVLPSPHLVVSAAGAGRRRWFRRRGASFGQRQGRGQAGWKGTRVQKESHLEELTLGTWRRPSGKRARALPRGLPLVESGLHRCHGRGGRVCNLEFELCGQHA